MHVMRASAAALPLHAVFLQVMWAHHDAPSMRVGPNPRVGRAANVQLRFYSFVCGAAQLYSTHAC
jgi:hypothetical protein